MYWVLFLILGKRVLNWESELFQKEDLNLNSSLELKKKEPHAITTVKKKKVTARDFLFTLLSFVFVRVPTHQAQLPSKTFILSNSTIFRCFLCPELQIESRPLNIICVWSLIWFWVTGPFLWRGSMKEKEWTNQENDGVMKTFYYIGFPLCLAVDADRDSAFPVRASLGTRSASGKNKYIYYLGRVSR